MVPRLFSVLCVLMVLGCAAQESPLPEDTPPLYDVSGAVTYNGAPLTDAILVFAPKSGKIGGSARTDAKGKFVARAFPPHDGMAAGDYMVAVTKTETVEINSRDPDNKATDTKHLIPRKYAQPMSSGLTLTVQPEANSDVVFELKD